MTEDLAGITSAKSPPPSQIATLAASPPRHQAGEFAADGEGELKVADFGSAPSDGSLHHTLCGTSPRRARDPLCGARPAKATSGLRVVFRVSPPATSHSTTPNFINMYRKIYAACSLFEWFRRRCATAAISTQPGHAH
ncbi:hypothetical protein ZWY2020_060090 [Hordeum vulgare]|nr:hypothetical protein ZWY2020_060090 [Hordeum vulgare]